jgi:exosortase
MNPRLLRESCLAVLAALVIAASPFTPGSLLPSLGIGAFCGVALFVYRMRSAPALAEGVDEAPAADIDWRPLAISGLVVALFLAVFAPTLEWMYEQWTRSVWVNNHGMFIPFVMAWMAREALREDSGEPEAGSAWGFAFLVPSLMLAVLDAGTEARYLAAAGFLLGLPGLCLLLLGPRRTGKLRVALLIGVLMMPVPYTLATPLALRTMTAQGVEAVLHLLGFSVLREGTLLYMPQNVFLVADACSGFATLYAAVAVALVLACYAKTFRRRVAVLAVAIPFALAANVARVTALVLLSLGMGEWILDTPLHEATGVVAFFVILVSLFLVADYGIRRGQT